MRHVSLGLLCLAASACETYGVVGTDSGTDAGRAVDAGRPDGGRDAGPRDAGYPVFTRIPESEAANGRESCAFARGAMPWETIGEEYPIGREIPIDHFILLMQENRSFDSYYGSMPGVEGRPTDASNPNASGIAVPAFHTTDYCVRDLGHGWHDSHQEWNNGANDGFVVANDPNGERTMGYFDESDLPFYWDLARTFALSDHHHCSLLGPTWVNRYYYYSATSFGLTSNTPVPPARRPAGNGNYLLHQLLDDAEVDWAIYWAGVPFIYGGYAGYSTQPTQQRRIHPLDDMWTALEDGTLPPVVWVDPTWDFTAGVDATDEHPPANPQRGQAWVRDLVERVMASPLWAHTAIVLTYDEHGGFYDHVAPPEACDPGDFPPDLGPGDPPGDFRRLGFRVPLMIISPYSRPGYVSDHVTDHSSIIRLVASKFLLPALSGRDANAWPLLDMFDFSTPALLTPPDLAEAPIDSARVDACHAVFP